MRIKQLAAVLAIGISAAGTFNANAQVPTGNTGTQHTTPTAAQRAQQDSVNRSTENVQDKGEIRNEQRGTANDHDMIQRENQQNANTKPHERNVNAQQPLVKQQPNTATQPQNQTRTRESSQTKTTTTPNGTTIQSERTQSQTQTPGQAPTQTRSSTKTITHPDGRVMTHDYEYYNDNIVVHDEKGRRYYIQNDQWMEVTDANKIERRMPTEEQRIRESNMEERKVQDKDQNQVQPQGRP